MSREELLAEFLTDFGDVTTGLLLRSFADCAFKLADDADAAIGRKMRAQQKRAMLLLRKIFDRLVPLEPVQTEKAATNGRKM